MRNNIQVEKPKILFVEGQDEVHLFSKLIDDLALSGDIQVEETGGRTNLHATIKSFKAAPNAHQITSIGVVRDADNDPGAALGSVRSALRKAGLPEPTASLQPASDGTISVTILILPGDHRPGMLEDVCLEAVSDDPAMTCVEEYFGCLARQKCSPHSVAIAKAHLRAFLVSRQLMEVALLDQLQAEAQTRWPATDVVSSSERIAAFLASRYKPDLRLGSAVEAGYLPRDHPAFDHIKSFLRLL